MVSITSPKYEIIDKDTLQIIKQNNDTIILDNIKEVHKYFKEYPNIKCIYGDMIINYDKHILYKHIPCFNMDFISSPDWQPILFSHDIQLNISDGVLLEIVKNILTQTFIHHIPIPLNTRQYE